MKKIGVDKWLHFLIGMIASMILVNFNDMLAIFAPLALGIAKEIYDNESKKGAVEPLDIIFTYLGGGAGYLIGHLLIDYGIIDR